MMPTQAQTSMGDTHGTHIGGCSSRQCCRSCHELPSNRVEHTPCLVSDWGPKYVTFEALRRLLLGCSVSEKRQWAFCVGKKSSQLLLPGSGTCSALAAVVSLKVACGPPARGQLSSSTCLQRRLIRASPAAPCVKCSHRGRGCRHT
eukprot:2932813-Amphidinium_carterae.1